MKGKSLFLLINELNKAERHQLLNICKRSGDKRHTALYQLMKRSSGIKDSFEPLLDACAKPLYGSKMDEKEKDKIQRRFIDFSLKEIEQIKLRNFLGDDLLLRNFLLSRIYESKGDVSIEQRYLERTGELSEKEGDRFMTAYYIDRMVDHTSRTHTKKDMQRLRELLIRKNELIQKSYHGELARIYDLLSVLSFEDHDLVIGLKGLVLKDDEVDVLLSLAAGSPEEVNYLIARARFSFFDPSAFKTWMKAAETAAKKIKPVSERDVLLKKIAFLNCQHHFHFGVEPAELLEQAKLLSESNAGLELFYYHLFRILDLAKRKRPLPEIKDLGKIRMEPENEFRVEFLQALTAYLNKDYGNALKRLNNLSYITNFQVSAWSRLLEMRIHLLKGNIGLCESLSGRITRYFQGNKSKEFTMPSNKAVFARFNDELKGRKPSKASAGPEAITALHQAILVH